jgi:hypothetical protein
MYWPAILVVALCFLCWAGIAAFVVKCVQPISDAVAAVLR